MTYQRLMYTGLVVLVSWFASLGCNGNNERTVPVPCEVDTQGNRGPPSPVEPSPPTSPSPSVSVSPSPGF